MASSPEIHQIPTKDIITAFENLVHPEGEVTEEDLQLLRLALKVENIGSSHPQGSNTHFAITATTFAEADVLKELAAALAHYDNIPLKRLLPGSDDSVFELSLAGKGRNFLKAAAEFNLSELASGSKFKEAFDALLSGTATPAEKQIIADTVIVKDNAHGKKDNTKPQAIGLVFLPNPSVRHYLDIVREVATNSRVEDNSPIVKVDASRVQVTLQILKSTARDFLTEIAEAQKSQSAQRTVAA